MTWEEKLQAIRSLDSEVLLRMYRPGDWGVFTDVEIGEGGMLVGAYGKGTNPEEAVLDLWNVLVTDLKAGAVVVIRAYSPNRREVRWNGFMWEDLPCSVSPVKKT
jgi:hypothetical protein